MDFSYLPCFDEEEDSYQYVEPCLWIHSVFDLQDLRQIRKEDGKIDNFNVDQVT